MLMGRSAKKKPNLSTIRRIKQALREGLDLPDDATVTVAELTCLEEGCAPVETVVGLLRPDAPQLQHKLHKETHQVDADDLTEVCTAWGFDVRIDALPESTKEN